MSFHCAPLYLLSHGHFCTFFLCMFGFSICIFTSGFYSWLYGCHFLSYTLVFYSFFSSHVALDRQPVLLCGGEWLLWMRILLSKNRQLSLPWELGGGLWEQDLYQDGSLMWSQFSHLVRLVFMGTNCSHKLNSLVSLRNQAARPKERHSTESQWHVLCTKIAKSLLLFWTQALNFCRIWILSVAPH